MARRGFLAEVQRQIRIAERERERAAREAARAHASLVREQAEHQKAAERALVAAERASEADRKRHEREAKLEQLAAREADAKARNQALDETYLEIDSLLAWTLAHDDYVDLTSLKSAATHPPFDRTDLETPVPPPEPVPDPPQPILQRPDPPRGLAGLFGKRKYEETVEQAERQHERALAAWAVQRSKAEERRVLLREQHARDEQARVASLAKEKARYASECRARESEAEEQNRQLDELITNLGYGTVEAVQEYVSIVLSNSVYPEHFPVNHEFEFHPAAAELVLRVAVPEPSALPTIKAYKYSKGNDEIVATALSQKECRERYASAVHQVALRSFHEIFEADRRGLVRTIALEVGTTAIDPATGHPDWIPFVIAAAERDAFMAFDLSGVVPAMALGKLGAAVSKNPYALVAAVRTGVRRV